MKLKTAILLGAGLSTALACASAFSGEVFSGYTVLQQSTKEMQDDDFLNLGMEAVAKGAKLFSAQGKNDKSCATCHGENGKKLDPKRIAQYPVLDAKTKRPITLQQRIIDEWATQLGNAPLKYESGDAVALETFVRNLAHGQVVNVQTDGAMAPFIEQGKALFDARVGQLNMACNLCHDHHPGQKLRAQTLSQGQTNGFPTYRLANSKVIGTQTRINQCFQSVRAEQQPVGSEAFALMELYMNAHGNGLKIETPAVRF